jgi:UDP-N-acetyl-D-glucosamine dehydrogenase
MITTPLPTKRFDVAIVGLGYVGVPLALGFAKAGCKTLGYDTDHQRVRELQQGRSPFAHISSTDLVDILADGTLEPTSAAARLAESDAIIVCVPTPLLQHQDPDLSHVHGVAKEIAPHLRRGMLVSLESSTYPGTTREEFRLILEQGSGLRAGKDFHLAFSPEREDPGNTKSKLRNMPKVIGGFTDECRDRATELYSKVIDQIVPVSSCDTAEAVKLTENIFRYINIALVNELKTIYSSLGIDIWEVLHAAKTKPFGFMPFYPGVGVGGHCIPIDPYYLTWKAKEHNIDCRFIELAGQINHSMPKYVVGGLLDAMNHSGQSLKGKSVLVIGVAYKPGVSDDRESQSYTIMNLLKAKGAKVDYHDSHVPLIPPKRGHWSGKRSIEWNDENLGRYAAAVVCTAHDDVDYARLADQIPLVVDACNVVPKDQKAQVILA